MGSFAGTSRFQVLRQLGAGGMGVVYEALDRERDERVALKTLHGMSPDALFRFKREFRALHGIEHPNLVRLGELIEHDGIWFFTMELVDGVDFLTHVWTKDWRAESRVAIEALTVRAGKPVAIDAGEAEVTETLDYAYDERRLRAALSQLATGIMAVHAAGKIHRDIKPSNVAVTRDGRVVLLDFGLITGVERGDKSTVEGVCGTPQYMAPEQVAVGDVGTPADWYSLGVMLYEALTARLPIDGNAVEIMADKLRIEPAPPSTFLEDVPSDLDALCVDLLRIDPKARPTGPQVAARLGSVEAPKVTSRPPEDRTSTSFFIGRRRDLDVLDQAWTSCRRETRAATVFVDGPSGMGKSALLHAFTRRISDADPGVVVFEGRSYEHESIPYNAFDHVIDTLAHFLRSLSNERAAELMPRGAWLLPYLFPVLGRVGPIVRLTRALSLQLDPQELRTRCFSAFRELLARIAERRPLVVILDDLQWAGRDSLMLLGEVMRPPDPPPMLLVLSSREARLPDPYAGDGANARWWALPDDLVRISLGPLPPEDARALATTLIDRAELPGLDPRAVAEEAEGHPLFVHELVRHAGVDGTSRTDRPRLDDVIRARTRAMDPTVRRALDLVIVAGSPIDRDVLASAAELTPGELARELAILERAHTVRDDGSGPGGAVRPFHNRVREAMLAALDPERLRDCHARLAEAYARAPHPDAERLTRHLVGAGDNARAAESALRAAEEAEKGLAFDRAAELYRLAINLKGGAPDREIATKLAHALAIAGRPVEAGDAFAAASAGAEEAVAIDLRGLAARQYVRAGQFDRGMALARDVLGKLGIRPPDGPRSALARTVWLRFVLWLRGLRIKVRAADSLALREARRVDFLHDLALVTSGADAVVGTWFTARAVLEAQRAGEPRRLARALSLDATWLASGGGGWSPRVVRIMKFVRDLEARCPEKSAWGQAMSGTIDFASARFPRALDELAASFAVFAAAPGTHFEIAMNRTFSTLVLYSLGRIGELRELSAERLRVALDSGDRYHSAFHRLGPCAVAAWLAPDQADRALEDIRVGVASWSRERFDVIAFAALAARVEVALYAGRPDEAWAEITRSWEALSGSMLLFVRFMRAWAFDLRGRAALACAIADPARRRELLADAERSANQLGRKRTPTGPEHAHLLRSGIAAIRGDTESERRELGAALAGYDTLTMGAHAAVAGRRLGELRGGQEGRELAEAADTWLRGQQIKRPDRWAQMLAPRAGKAR